MKVELNREALQDHMAMLDAQVKRLLSQKVILAWILGRTVEEFRGMPHDRIMDCIEGEPEVGREPSAARGRMTVITGRRNEEGELVKVIVNVEAQKDFYPGYSIVTRGVFYGAREISSQKHREFEGSDYDSVKKVYSIWICMDAPREVGNAITQYSIQKRDLIPGIPDRPSEYDKLAVVVVTLNEEVETEDRFIGLMHVLLTDRIPLKEKIRILEEEYQLPVRDELEEGVRDMCNYSEYVWEKGVREGRREGLEEGIEKGRQEGMERGQEETIRRMIERQWERGRTRDVIVEMLEDVLGLQEQEALRRVEAYVG